MINTYGSLDNIKIVTLAPELKNADTVIQSLTSLNVSVSVGKFCLVVFIIIKCSKCMNFCRSFHWEFKGWRRCCAKWCNSYNTFI